MKNITVIGAGTMGNGIAHTFAQKGFKVALVERTQEAIDRGLGTISKNLDRMIAKERITEADKSATLGNITTFLD
ncbi:3-hydroxyacyl-CoA dehydrogenase NAD-binding domain-containing protein, partial [Nonlabens ulvanivorans]